MNENVERPVGSSDGTGQGDVLIPRNMMRLGMSGAFVLAGLAFLAIGLGGAILTITQFGNVGGDVSQIFTLICYALLSIVTLALGVTLATAAKPERGIQDGGFAKRALMFWMGMWILFGLMMIFIASDTSFGPSLSDGILVALAGLFSLIAVLVYRASLEVKVASGVLALTGVILLMIADTGALGGLTFLGFDVFSAMSTGVFYAVFLLAIPTAVLYSRDNELRYEGARILAGITFAVAGIGGLVEGVQWLDSSPWSSIGNLGDTGAQVAAWFNFAGGIAWFVAAIVTLVVSVLVVINALPDAMRTFRANVETQPARQQAAGDGRPSPGSQETAAAQGSTGDATGPSPSQTQTVQRGSDTGSSDGVFCSDCGTEVETGASFCPECGSEVAG